MLTLQTSVCFISSLSSSPVNFLMVSEPVSLQLNQTSKSCPMLCSYRIGSIQTHFAVRLIFHFSSCDSGFVPFFFLSPTLVVYSCTNEYRSQLHFLPIITWNVRRMDALKRTLEPGDRTRKKYHQS
jgi:hypothetical protein